MKITILGSGSKGNSTLIQTNNTNILIDAGLPLKTLEKRYKSELPNLDIILITHSHSDHTKGLKSILKKHNPIIYTQEKTLDDIVEYRNIRYDKEISIENINIELFELSHDVPCIGIYIKSNNKELIYITDTGYINNKLIKKYKNKDIYIIESNYEEEMLLNGTYPFYLKQRIRSDKGHISNSDTKRYLKQLIGDTTKYICLAHLSEENNSPEIVINKTKELLNEIPNSIKETIICSQIEAKEIKM